MIWFLTKKFTGLSMLDLLRLLISYIYKFTASVTAWQGKDNIKIDRKKNHLHIHETNPETFQPIFRVVPAGSVTVAVPQSLSSLVICWKITGTVDLPVACLQILSFITLHIISCTTCTRQSIMNF